MIFSHVQDRGCHGLQTRSGFQLEAGQFKHIQLASRIEQHQRWQANIAADADVNARRFRHIADQRRNRTFAVRTGNRHNRRLGFTAKQFNIADNFNARICCRA
ncbi:hypothetical protein D3C72_1694750 [compost metagenome]